MFQSMVPVQTRLGLHSRADVAVGGGVASEHGAKIYMLVRVGTASQGQLNTDNYPNSLTSKLDLSGDEEG